MNKDIISLELNIYRLYIELLIFNGKVISMKFFPNFFILYYFGFSKFNIFAFKKITYLIKIKNSI